MSLQRRARKQAAEERAEKIQSLKNKGIIVQTAEEREQYQTQVEDLLEKARQQVAELSKKEKAAAKKNGDAGGAEDGSMATSDDDEDYQEPEAERSQVEYSGSEEDSEDEEEVVGVDQQEDKNDLIEDEASEDADDEEDIADGSEVDEELEDGDGILDEDIQPQNVQARSRGARRVIDDEDEDEESITYPTVPAESASPSLARTEEKQQLPMLDANSPPLGMTQAFACTMADTQTQTQNESWDKEQEQDSVEFLGLAPEPDMQMFDTGVMESIIRDSQTEVHDTNQNQLESIKLDFSQSQVQHVEDTQEFAAATQFSEMPDPTQDAGFALSSPIPNRFATPPPSTVETVLLSNAENKKSPVVRRKGRLHRREIANASRADEEKETVLSGEKLLEANAFEVLKRRANTETFDKKKSEAKDMVEEQAQESEDEYAGLGGASDEDSNGEVDEEMQKMIEEENIDVDERQLAAFYA